MLCHFCHSPTIIGRRTKAKAPVGVQSTGALIRFRTERASKTLDQSYPNTPFFSIACDSDFDVVPFLQLSSPHNSNACFGSKTA